MREKEAKLNFLLIGVLVLTIVFTFILSLSYVNTQKDSAMAVQKSIDHPKIVYDRYLTRLAINSTLTGDMYYLSLGFYSQLAQSSEIATHIISQCIKYGVPIDLAFAIAAYESGFNPEAINRNVNKDGYIISIDRGLFQLNSKTFPNVDWFNPKENATYGIKYLKERYDVAGSWEGAVLLYNAGLYVNVAQRSFIYMKKVLLIERLLDEEFNSFRRNLNITTISNN